MKKIILCVISLFIFPNWCLAVGEPPEGSSTPLVYSPVQIKLIQPKIVKFSPTRSVTGYSKYLSDIESHMPAGHQYRDSDKGTWAHETTHGINSRIRSAYANSGKKLNGFYILDNNAVLIEEPPLTLSTVARYVPTSLRGDVYKLYMVEQRQYWENEPLYVLDEWTAYTNGVIVRSLEYKLSPQGSGQYMLELMAYSFSLCMAVEAKNRQIPGSYDDRQLKAFVMWHAKRSMYVYKLLQSNSKTVRLGQKAYLRKFQKAENLTKFIRWYCGKEWTKRILGF